MVGEKAFKLEEDGNEEGVTQENTIIWKRCREWVGGGNRSQ